MSLKDLNAKLQAIKPEAGSSGGAFKKKGFLKEKIRNGTIAAAAKVARASEIENRSDASPVEIIHTPKQSTMLRKVERLAARLADKMTEEDLDADVIVVREARKAMSRAYDPATKTMIEVPDHRMRLAAAAFARSYAEGLPVARQVQLTAELGGMDDALEQIKASPALAALLGQLIGGKAVEPENPPKTDFI